MDAHKIGVVVNRLNHFSENNHWTNADNAKADNVKLGIDHDQKNANTNKTSHAQRPVTQVRSLIISMTAAGLISSAAPEIVTENLPKTEQTATKNTK